MLGFTLHKCIGWIYKKLLEFEDKNSLWYCLCQIQILLLTWCMLLKCECGKYFFFIYFFGISVLAWQKIAARVCSKKAVASLERDFVKTYLSYHVWKNNTIIQHFWTLILIAQTAFQGCWYLTAMGDLIFCMLCLHFPQAVSCYMPRDSLHNSERKTLLRLRFTMSRIGKTQRVDLTIEKVLDI